VFKGHSRADLPVPIKSKQVTEGYLTRRPETLAGGKSFAKIMLRLPHSKRKRICKIALLFGRRLERIHH